MNRLLGGKMSASQFVRLFGYLFALFFVLTVMLYYQSFFISDFPPSLRRFVAANAIFYLIGSVTILSRRLAGYYLLKVFLGVLLLAFPIGTIIGVKILRYMKRQNIRSVFQQRV